MNWQTAGKRGDFDFQHKKVAFYQGGWIDKQEFFRGQTERAGGESLPILTAEEKERAKGYDVIVMVWEKFKVTDEKRKMLVRRLGEDGRH